MTTITMSLPDHLARRAAERGAQKPGWLETLVHAALTRGSADRPPAEPAASPLWSPAYRSHANPREEQEANEWLCGCCEGLVGPHDVDRFLAERRAEEAREVAPVNRHA